MNEQTTIQKGSIQILDFLRLHKNLFILTLIHMLLPALLSKQIKITKTSFFNARLNSNTT